LPRLLLGQDDVDATLAPPETPADRDLLSNAEAESVREVHDELLQLGGVLDGDAAARHVRPSLPFPKSPGPPPPASRCGRTRFRYSDFRVEVVISRSKFWNTTRTRAVAAGERDASRGSAARSRS